MEIVKGSVCARGVVGRDEGVHGNSTSCSFFHKYKNAQSDFPGGPVVKNLPCMQRARA